MVGERWCRLAFGRRGVVGTALLLGTVMACGRGDSKRDATALVRGLGSALDHRRPFEPRLSHGFEYAACRVDADSTRLMVVRTCAPWPEPGTAAFAELTAAIRDIRTAAESGPSAPVAWASGIASLLFHVADSTAVDRALEALRDAADSADGDPDVLNDLAVAYFLRAQARGQPVDLLRALTAVERAVEHSPRHLAALFNRGLILDRLFLQFEAEAAWRLYLNVDSTTRWAEEARHRLLPPAELVDQADLVARAADGDTAAAALLARRFPQAARTLALDELLPGWAEHTASGEPQGAAELLSAARVAGDELSRRGGDEAVRDAVAAIGRSAANPPLRHRLVRGHQAYGRGRRAYNQSNLEVAAESLGGAHEALVDGGSPAAAGWAAAWLAGVAIRQGRHPAARIWFREVFDAASGSRYPALLGRRYWGSGLMAVREGNFAESLAHYYEAQRQFREAGESENLAAVHSLIAENLARVGRPREAWTHRYEALGRIARAPTSLTAHNVLIGAAKEALEEGHHQGALALLDEDVLRVTKGGTNQSRAEGLHRRARTKMALGLPSAASDLAEARALAEAIPSAVTRNRSLAEISELEAELGAREDPAATIREFTRNFDYFAQRRDSVRMMTLLVNRARAFAETGKYESAESDLRRAVSMVERRWASIEVDSLDPALVEATQEVFNELILLQAEQLHDPEAALESAERARAYALGKPLLASFHAERTVPRIGDRRTVLSYAVAGDRIVLWAVADGLTMRILESPAAAVESRVEEFVEALAAGTGASTVPRLSRELYDLLIAPVADRLPADRELVIIPDRFLANLPFAALTDAGTGRYLIEDRVISFAPNLEFLERLGQTDEGDVRGRRALLVGDPAFDRRRLPWLARLPAAEEEVGRLGALYPDSYRLVGPAATRPALLASLDRFPVFHYAGHAVFHAQQPWRSFLALAPDPARSAAAELYARNLRGLTFDNLRLVVLSACNTLASGRSRGGGLSGLALPFLRAGAAAVVGSLWEVEDEAAMQLVVAFHREWLSGLGGAEALRAAQLEVLRSTDAATGARSSWAAFQIVGVLP